MLRCVACFATEMLRNGSRSNANQWCALKQIPHIASARYPPELSGKLYPDGIPISSEDRLEEIISSESVDECLMAYSEVSYTDIMKLSARCRAAGARFTLLGR